MRQVYKEDLNPLHCPETGVGADRCKARVVPFIICHIEFNIDATTIHQGIK